MKHKSISQLLEEIRDNEAQNREWDAKEHAEKMRKRSASEADWQISSWKRAYFRKNGKRDAKISVLNGQIETGEGFQDYYRLQLFLDNYMTEEIQLDTNAFMYLTQGLEKIELPGIDRYTYLHHQKTK